MKEGGRREAEGGRRRAEGGRRPILKVGDPRTWGADYRAFARQKAALAWRAGCDTHLIQELRPHLL
ncbi:MAG: hypothetical protein ACM3NQ_03060, partial [Bacteroidales bacterium]